jgi:site-specific DNA-cytosine methylase
VWFTKRHRAANDQDYESWESGRVMPTLNAMDNSSESFATAVRVEGLGVRRLTPVECERLQGFPDDWTDGQSDSNRYRQLGNAVTVNVAEWIGQRLMETEQ